VASFFCHTSWQKLLFYLKQLGRTRLVKTTNALKKTEIKNGSTDFRIWLQQQFTDRCKRNPRYSLRAFAQLIQMDASSLSQIFAGKRKASTKVINGVCAVLGAEPQQQERFVQKAKAKFKSGAGTTDAQDSAYELMSQDAFKVISDWYHFAILELINVDGFQGRAAWCARALSITTVEAQMALERLERLSLIRQEEGHWVRTNKMLTNFAPGTTSSAHKHMQRQILQMALDAIDNVGADEKDITCMTMAIDVEKIPQARRIITKFRRDLSAYLEDGPQSRVYQLAIQLYPASKEIKPPETENEK
jgi:uncharacterized protein (TIGR02147 family)